MSDWNDYGQVEDPMYRNDWSYDDDRRGMRGRMEGMGDQARHMSDRARSGFSHYFNEHPLTFGLGAVALGMIVGMVIPSSRPEARFMGDAAQQVRARTRETASELGDVARAGFEEARDTMKHEFEERGMDAQSMKEGAREATEEAKDAARRSAQEGRKAAEEEAQKKNLH